MEVFLRDDDVYEINQDFLAFYELTKKFKIPMLYAVIPAKLTQEMRDFIIRNNLQIAQHGYQHTNYGIQTKYEFGVTRSEQQQREDIEKGFKILKEEVPNNFNKIFVPPFHGFNETTINILKEMNMSLSVPQDVELENLQVDICLEIFEDRIIPTEFNEFVKQFVKKMKTTTTIGIYTHHQYVDVYELTKILKFLRALHLSGKIQLINFGENYAIAYS